MPAAEVWVTCRVAPRDRVRFEEAAVSAARAHELIVLIEDTDGVVTARFLQNARVAV